MASWVPTEWMAHRESIAEKPDLIQQLMQNKNYSKLSPAAEELQGAINQVQQLHKNTSPYVQAEVIKSAMDQVQQVRDTICVTYALFILKSEIPEEKSPGKRKQLADKLRQQMRDRNSHMPPSIDKALAAAETSEGGCRL